MAFFGSEISRNAFSGCVRTHVFQSSRPTKLEVNSALFPYSLPAIPKPPQSEHVIIRLVSLSEFPRYDHSFHQFVPHFFSSLSLTHYCSYPWLWLLRPDDQTDIRHHQIPNCNCPNFCFFILYALLEFLNGLLWVRDFHERFLGVCAHACISIIET